MQFTFPRHFKLWISVKIREERVSLHIGIDLCHKDLIAPRQHHAVDLAAAADVHFLISRPGIFRTGIRGE